MLKVKDLHVSIGNRKILKGININIKYGEIHVIMGPNGSGKSTLSSVITGKSEYNITNGDIIFEEKSIINTTPEERAHIGIFLSFQNPIEIPGISMINFIRTSLNSIRKARGLEELNSSEILKKIYEIAKLFNINKEFLYRSLNYGFSGGEKKISEMFQMAMLEPKLSILDEIDSGLDIDALRIVSNGIKSIKKNNNSILIITHYQRLLNYISPDYVHVLYEGKIVKSGDYQLAFELEKKGYDWIK